jgi:hypothetical protein
MSEHEEHLKELMAERENRDAILHLLSGILEAAERAVLKSTLAAQADEWLLVKRQHEAEGMRKMVTEVRARMKKIAEMR